MHLVFTVHRIDAFNIFSNRACFIKSNIGNYRLNVSLYIIISKCLKSCSCTCGQANLYIMISKYFKSFTCGQEFLATMKPYSAVVRKKHCKFVSNVDCDFTIGFWFNPLAPRAQIRQFNFEFTFNGFICKGNDLSQRSL